MNFCSIVISKLYNLFVENTNFAVVNPYIWGGSARFAHPAKGLYLRHAKGVHISRTSPIVQATHMHAADLSAFFNATATNS